MADKVAEQKQVESTVEEVEKPTKVTTKNTEETSTTEDEVKSENGNNKEAQQPEENGEDDTEKSCKDAEKNGTTTDATNDKVCSIKRKSTGGAVDATDGTTTTTPAEGATPEKKAKLDENAAEAESNGETEVAA